VLRDLPGLEVTSRTAIIIIQQHRPDVKTEFKVNVAVTRPSSNRSNACSNPNEDIGIFGKPETAC
jgi:hypothetical protein